MFSNISFPTFSTVSPQAAEITHLFLWVFIVCTIIFLVVAVWVGYSLVKFRHRGEEGEPDQHQISKTYEITWTIIPTLICVGLAWITVVSMFGPRSGEPIRKGDPDIIITGAQWWWEIKYPKLGVITANEIHIPVGRPIQVQLESNDVIHTFWVPDMGRKQQMIPGHHNSIVFQADKVGEYLGACAQYCGNQHAWMRLLLVAESDDDFNKWAANQAKGHPVPAAEPAAATPASAHLIEATQKITAVEKDTLSGGNPVSNPSSGAVTANVPAHLGIEGDLASGDVARGLHIYQQQTCGTCHAIDGVSSARYAPDLSHIASRETLGSGVISNSPENLYKWLYDPQAIKPGCNMPTFHLSPEQTRDVTAYLETLN
jgi:cytochrome c oxidase subunit 2